MNFPIEKVLINFFQRFIRCTNFWKKSNKLQLYYSHNNISKLRNFWINNLLKSGTTMAMERQNHLFYIKYEKCKLKVKISNK